MHLDIQTIQLIIIGLVTGLVTGITGASGVMIIIPLLTLLLALPIHEAIGMSLIIDVMASLPIALIYYWKKHVRIGAAIWLVIGALFGAQAGALLSVGFLNESFLVICLVAFMLILGINLWRKGGRESIAEDAEKKENMRAITRQKLQDIKNNPLRIPGYVRDRLIMSIDQGMRRSRHVTLALIGIGFGLLTGLFGAGGGILVFTVLYFIMRFDIKTAIGTSTAVMALTALSGAFGYVHQYPPDWHVVGVLGGSALVGGVSSALFANKVNPRILSRLVAVIFILLAVVTIVFRAV